jgi:hypothetical protein
MLQPGKNEETLLVMMKGVPESQYLKKLSKCPLLDIKKIHNTSRAQLDLDDKGKDIFECVIERHLTQSIFSLHYVECPHIFPYIVGWEQSLEIATNSIPIYTLVFGP